MAVQRTKNVGFRLMSTAMEGSLADMWANMARAFNENMEVLDIHAGPQDPEKMHVEVGAIRAKE